MMINVNDFDKIAEQLKINKNHDNYEKLIQKYTGPGTGLIWDEETETIKIASGWYADANGDIVRK